MEVMKNNNIDVSVILPVHNADPWLEQCLQSLLLQDFEGSMELSVYDDASTDNSRGILDAFCPLLERRGIRCTLSGGGSGEPGGVGFAKNRAIAQSVGEYLCFLDADDVMMRGRVKEQYEACRLKEDVIVGCRFHREPTSSTPRYTHWANTLTHQQLQVQVYTSFGPTVVMPTWFCHRKVFERVGGFESRKGIPEDLLFFYRHLELGGRVVRLDADLLLYRYHMGSATFSITECTLWDVRLCELEQRVLERWSTFTIWSAGKQGRKLYRSLSQDSRQKVQAFCDVDIKKLSKGIYIYEESPLIPKPRVPILHFSEATPPFILCVKLAMTAGAFESNLASLGLTEGLDYVHFS